jgi:hypothetical protein
MKAFQLILVIFISIIGAAAYEAFGFSVLNMVVAVIVCVVLLAIVNFIGALTDEEEYGDNYHYPLSRINASKRDDRSGRECH